MLRKVFFLFIIISGLIGTGLNAQDMAIGAGKKYTIGGITVTGTTNFNEQTVIAFTGLRKGQEIFVPGDKISEVIKKLWDLDLFSDIKIYITDIQGDEVFLEINITEVPELNKVFVTGLKKEKHEKKLIKEQKLKSGKKVTENLLATTRRGIQNQYRKDGFLNARVLVKTEEVPDTTENIVKKVNMHINIDKGEKVKIKQIEVEGNDVFTEAKVRRQMSTKRKNFFRFWKRSKFIDDTFKSDKEEIVNKYKSEGFRDARVVSDTLIVLDDKTVKLKLKVEEGNKYYFGKINFLGNTVYSDEELYQVLQIKKGDTYNGVLLDKRIADNTQPDAEDISNLYQNNGYLFSQINPVETRVYNDTIDYEIRIHEGKVAHFDHVYVTGNDKTNDHVIYRNLRTRPGNKYSKQDVVRTIRELGQLGFFDAEKLSPDFENVNPNDGTLDLHYNVSEVGSSQIELQGGYGGGGFVGTLGLSFHNFSIKNIFNKDSYKPLPSGDGQTLSLRAQAASYYQTYSVVFEEPWLGGKKPIRLSTSVSHTIENYYDYWTRSTDRNRRFLITGVSVGLAKRLEWPDDFFTLSGAVSFQHYSMHNYNIGLFRFPEGNSNNLAFTFGLSRDNTYTNPIFPTGGSRFAITAKVTPPYSLFNGIKYDKLQDDPEYQDLKGDPDLTKIDQKKFNWLEYYKIKFSGDWYNKLVDKFVLRTNIEYGFLGAYNNARGIPPFERFYVGGDGMGTYSLDGRENIRLRGYPNQSITPIDRDPSTGATRNDGSTIYNRYSMELRYPITLKPMASIYVLGFMEGGASYDSFKDFNPFQLNRSAGLGVRIFMPQFGLLGIDFAYGFDPIPGTFSTKANGWETHFIIGQNF